MRQVKSLLSLVCASALLTAATAGFASAQNFNRTTKVTFSAPVELPTMTLPAGTYTFRLTDSTSDRHVVQVFDADGTKLVTMLHAIPAKRLETSEETVITFRETPALATPPIRFWYYPNDQMGQEFAYPRERAQAIANAIGEPVLAIDDDEIVRVEPAPAAAPVVEPAPVTVPDTPVAPPDTTVAQPEPTPMAPERLPQTAGELPLVGLIGLLALGGALLMRAFRRATV
jgi:hypothetical protein